MKNSNLKEIFKEYSEFVPKELQSEINNSNAVALLGMYISFSISNHSNKVTVTNDQIKKTFNWESNQVQRANSKLEVMKLISREVSTKRGVPSIVTLLFKEESQQKEMRQEEQQAIEKRNTPMPPANDKDSSMMELILQEIESLKEEISTLREENKNLKEELSILKEEIKDLKEDNSKLKQGMKIFNRKLYSQSQEISTLRDSNNDTSTENASKTSGNASPVASNPQVTQSSYKIEEKPLGEILEKIIEDVPQVEVQRVEKRNVEKDDRFSPYYLEKWYSVFNAEIPSSTEGLSLSARKEIIDRFINTFSDTLPQEESIMILMMAMFEKYNKVHSGTKSKELLLKAISNANKAVGFNLHELLTNLPRKQELMEKFYKS